MADKRKMTLDELELLMRSLHREFLQDPSKITGDRDESFFFEKIHMFHAKGCGAFWPTINKNEYECRKPGFSSFSARKRYEKVEALMLEICERGPISSIEAEIIAAVP